MHCRDFTLVKVSTGLNARWGKSNSINYILKLHCVMFWVRKYSYWPRIKKFNFLILIRNVLELELSSIILTSVLTSTHVENRQRSDRKERKKLCIAINIFERVIISVNNCYIVSTRDRAATSVDEINSNVLLIKLIINWAWSQRPKQTPFILFLSTTILSILSLPYSLKNDHIWLKKCPYDR